MRPAIRSTAEPSTLIITSKAPTPVPATTKATASSGTDPSLSATPRPASPATMTSNAALMAQRLPSQCINGPATNSPPMAPAVTDARSRPIVAVLIPRLAFNSGQPRPLRRSRDPAQPERNGIVQRQRPAQSLRHAALVVAGTGQNDQSAPLWAEPARHAAGR